MFGHDRPARVYRPCDRRPTPPLPLITTAIFLHPPTTSRLPQGESEAQIYCLLHHAGMHKEIFFFSFLLFSLNPSPLSSVKWRHTGHNTARRAFVTIERQDSMYVNFQHSIVLPGLLSYRLGGLGSWGWGGSCRRLGYTCDGEVVTPVVLSWYWKREMCVTLWLFCFTLTRDVTHELLYNCLSIKNIIN